MAKATMCAYPQSDNVLPHLKFVLQCCDKCTRTNLTDQEIDDQYTDTSVTIRFHIYHMIACCTKHVRLMLTDRKICRKCQQVTVSGQSTKIYT